MTEAERDREHEEEDKGWCGYNWVVTLLLICKAKTHVADQRRFFCGLLINKSGFPKQTLLVMTELYP